MCPLSLALQANTQVMWWGWFSSVPYTHTFSLHTLALTTYVHIQCLSEVLFCYVLNLLTFLFFNKLPYWISEAVYLPLCHGLKSQVVTVHNLSAFFITQMLLSNLFLKKTYIYFSLSTIMWACSKDAQWWNVYVSKLLLSQMNDTSSPPSRHFPSLFPGIYSRITNDLKLPP